MYSSAYSQVSKFGPAAQKKMHHRSKGKSCGYYMRVIFFFSSLIQSLIIVSLVLFLVYGKQQDSASTARIQDLEQSFSRLSIENVALRQQRKNLTNFLNVTLTEKARNDWDLAQMYSSANMSLFFLLDLNKRLNQCNMERIYCKPGVSTGLPPCRPVPMMPGNCNCGMQLEQLRAMVELVQTNFTQTTQIMKMEMEQVSRDRDKQLLEAIQLRRDKSVLLRNLAHLKVRCRDDFSQALSGISNVSKAFLEKIDSLFPQHIAFQLTCDKQRENLNQIRTNCTNLSREVENKLQVYLNEVQSKMLETMADNSNLKAENWRVSYDYNLCNQNRTAMISEHKQNTQAAQLRHDQEKEKLLLEKGRLIGDKNVLVSDINLKEKQIAHVNEQMRQLNYSCMAKAALGLLPASGGSSAFGTNTQSQSGSVWNKLSLGGGASSSSSSSSGNPFGRTGSSTSLGSTGVGLNKVGSSGLGSSSFGSKSPSTSLGSTGLGLNKLGTSGTGSSSSFGSSAGSTGSGSSFGSTGFGLTKPGSASAGSSSSGSTGSSANTGSSGFSLNKSGTSGKTPATSGSTTASKSGTANSGFSFWSGFGSSSSNSGQSKTGTGTGKGSTGGNTAGGSGSTSAGGRTSGLVRVNGGQAISVSQHLQDLQRLVNPSNSEDNQELSRVLG